MPSRRRRQALGGVHEWTNEGRAETTEFLSGSTPVDLWIWPNEALTLAHTCPQLTAATERRGTTGGLVSKLRHHSRILRRRALHLLLDFSGIDHGDHDDATHTDEANTHGTAAMLQQLHTPPSRNRTRTRTRSRTRTRYPEADEAHQASQVNDIEYHQ